MDQLYKTGGEIMTCRSCQQVGPNGPNDVGMGRNAATYPDISGHIHHKHSPEVSLVIDRPT